MTQDAPTTYAASVSPDLSPEHDPSLGTDDLALAPGFGGGARRVVRRFVRQPLSVAAAIVLLLIAAFAYGAPLVSKWITHMGYQQQNLEATLLPPGATVKVPVVEQSGKIVYVTHTFLLGSDELGRDVLTRLAYGGRISMSVGIGAVMFALALGVTAGLIAGYLGGVVDTLLMRMVDVILSIPNLFILILISTLVNNSSAIAQSSFYRSDGWLLLPVAIGIVAWTTVARLVRAEVLVIRELDYIAGARVAGVSTRRILWRHILPNAMPVVLIWGTLTIPTMILLEASLSYLGFGAQIPTPSWGNMLSNATQFLFSDPTLVILPGVMILLTGMSINIVGNGLQRALDPRS